MNKFTQCGAGVARLSRELAFKSAVGVTSAAARFLIDVGKRGGRFLSRSVQYRRQIKSNVPSPQRPPSIVQRTQKHHTRYRSKNVRCAAERTISRPSVHQGEWILK